MTNYGYDFEPTTGNGIYLRLKNKGDRVKIRLVSKPIHYKKEFQGKEMDKFAWLVIDKTDVTNPRVKGFEAGVMIYKSIKDFATNPEWGDPTQYDFTIERTEEAGNYYTVVPSPNKMPLTEDERKLVRDSDLNLETMFQVEEDLGTSTFGGPQSDEDAVSAPKEDEEVDLSNLPF